MEPSSEVLGERAGDDRVSPFGSRRLDYWFRRIAAGAFLAALLGLAALYYYGPQDYTRVGYARFNPSRSRMLSTPASSVSRAFIATPASKMRAAAKIPPTQTCMSCHQAIKADSPKIAAVKASFESGKPIPWVRVHQVPDYVFFNHAVHVKRGVGCVSCHGHVNEMQVVAHDQSLSMGWCLDCHREPENHLRPLAEVTNLAWKPQEGRAQRDLGLYLRDEYKVQAPEQCAGCHR